MHELVKRDDVYRHRTSQPAAAPRECVIERLTRHAATRGPSCGADFSPRPGARAEARATPKSARGRSRFELVATIVLLDLFALTACAILGTYQPYAIDGCVAIAAFAAVAATVAFAAYKRLGTRQSGYTLLEALVVLATIGIVVLAAVPAFATYRRRTAMISAANELRATLRLVRAHAVDRGNYAGVKFTQANGTWWVASYDDGDKDGIRNDDIAKGIDVRYAGPSPLMPQLHAARVGLLPYAIKDPDGDPLPPTNAAVNFNNSTLCSFSPLGSATPGSIYLTDDAGGLYCVRVYGASGRVRVMRYDGGRKKWELR